MGSSEFFLKRSSMISWKRDFHKDEECGLCTPPETLPPLKDKGEGVLKYLFVVAPVS